MLPGLRILLLYFLRCLVDSQLFDGCFSISQVRLFCSLSFFLNFGSLLIGNYFFLLLSLSLSLALARSFALSSVIRATDASFVAITVWPCFLSSLILFIWPRALVAGYTLVPRFFRIDPSFITYWFPLLFYSSFVILLGIIFFCSFH